MADINDIRQNLLNLGLDETEAQVYIAGLEHETESILNLSKQTHIPRTTVYRAAEALVAKKFATWVVENNARYLKVTRPSKLSYLVEEKRTELEKSQSSLQQLQLMVTDFIKEVPKTEVRYYQGKEGIKQMIWNCLSAEDEIIGYSQFGRKEITGESFYNKYVEEFKVRGIRDRAIGNENALKYITGYVVTAKHQMQLSDVRIIPKSKFYVSGDYSIYNNVYAVAYWDKGEVVGVEIENPELVKLQKSIFEILWNVADPIEKYFN